MVTRIIALSLLICSWTSHAHVTYIIVHGMWGKTSDWHKPDGDFYCALKESAAQFNDSVDRFTWSGDVTHAARLKAAKKLANKIEICAKKGDVNIVSHSQGTNVAIIAINLLASRKKKVDPANPIVQNMYGFGTPVDTKFYNPNMDAIGRLYNFFSVGDYYQPGPVKQYHRTYPEQERIVNIRVTLDGKHPSHFNVRSPVVAQWLPSTHNFDDIQECEYGNFRSFDFTKQGVIHFMTDELPCYEIDDVTQKYPSRQPSWRKVHRSPEIEIDHVPPRPLPQDTLSEDTPDMPVCAAA